MALSVLPPIPRESITIIPGDMRKDKNKKYKKLCHDLGITEILLGFASLLLSSSTLVVIKRNDHWNNNITHMATGVWCGIMVMISGVLGICWKNKISKTLLNMNLLMSIVSCVFTGIQLIISLISCLASEGHNTLVTLHAFLALLAFVSLTVCILHSSYTCAAKCCFPWLSTGQVLYHGVTGQYIQLDNGQTLLLQNDPLEGTSTDSTQDAAPKQYHGTSMPPAYSEIEE